MRSSLFSNGWLGKSMLLALLAVATAAGVRAEPLSRAAVVQRAKPTVALLAAGPRRGPAVCIDPSGLFVTVYRLTNGALEDNAISLVIDAGLKTQKTLRARVARQDKSLGLALVQADTDDRLPALDLGTDDRLVELTDVVVLGFPDEGSMRPDRPVRPRMPRAADSPPTISVQAASIKSLKLDDSGELRYIQLNAGLEPGYVGGPLVDMNARLLGLVGSGESRPEEPFAMSGQVTDAVIPVRFIRQLVERPVIVLSAPGVTQQNKRDEARFAAAVTTFGKGGQNLDVKLLLKSPGVDDRTIPMTLESGKYVAKAVPFPGENDEFALRLDIRFRDGAITAAFKEQELHFGDETVKLSQVKHLTLGDRVLLETSDGETRSMVALKPTTVTARLCGQQVDLKLDTATELAVVEPGDESRVACTVIVLSSGREIGRCDDYLYLEGSRQDSLDNIRDGKFLKPLRGIKPSTYFKAVSTGGYIAGTRTFDYSENELHFSGSLAGMTVNVDGYRVEFAAPQGAFLKPGEYDDAKRAAFRDNSPGLDFSGNGRGSNTVGGKFVVWEYEVKSNQLVKAAIDFVFRSEGSGPPIYGMVRYHSSFK